MLMAAEILRHRTNPPYKPLSDAYGVRDVSKQHKLHNDTMYEYNYGGASYPRNDASGVSRYSASYAHRNKSQLLPLTIGPDSTYLYIVIKRVVPRVQSATYESVRHLFNECGIGYATDLICDFINDEGIIIKNSQGEVICQHSSPGKLGYLADIPIPAMHLTHGELIVTTRSVSKYPLMIEFDILNRRTPPDHNSLFLLSPPLRLDDCGDVNSAANGFKIPAYNMVFAHGVVKNMKKFERR
jgi:hypothetical protein